MANIAFQKEINSQKPWGVAGDFMDDNYNHMYPLTLLVKEYEGEDDVKVEVGKFVWDNGDGTCSAKGTGQPAGIVHRVLDIPITDIANGATMIVPSKYKVGIADCCSIFITVSDKPTVGNKIFVNNTTGAITNVAQGATVSGATETSFRIKTLCDNTAAAGILVGVSNWGERMEINNAAE